MVGRITPTDLKNLNQGGFNHFDCHYDNDDDFDDDEMTMTIMILVTMKLKLTLKLP